MGSLINQNPVLFEDEFVEILGFPVGGLHKIGQQANSHLVDVFIDLLVVNLVLEADKVEEVVPLALLLYIVDIVVDEVGVVALEEGQPVPLVVYYAPNVLLLLFHVLQQLDLVVELLNCGEAVLVELDPPADLALALLLHFYVKGFLTLGGLDPRDEVDGEDSADLDGLQGRDHPIAVEVDGRAVGVALALEVEHLLPDAVAVLLGGLVEALLLEDAPLHLVKELLLGHGLGQVFELVEVGFPLCQFGVALAGQSVDQLLEILVVEVVYLYLLQERHERFLEVVPALLDVYERFCYQDQLVLAYRLPCEVPQLAVDEGEVHFLGGVFSLRNRPLQQSPPVEHP